MFVESYILKKRQLGIHDVISTLLIAVELLVPGVRNNPVTVQARIQLLRKIRVLLLIILFSYYYTCLINICTDGIRSMTFTHIWQ